MYQTACRLTKRGLANTFVGRAQAIGSTSSAGSASLAAEDEHNAVLGVDLTDLPEHGSGGEAASGKAARNTYAVKLAYFGPAFSAWAWTCDMQGTTQGAVQRALADACSLDPGQEQVHTAATHCLYCTVTHRSVICPGTLRV